MVCFAIVRLKKGFLKYDPACAYQRPSGSYVFRNGKYVNLFGGPKRRNACFFMLCLTGSSHVVLPAERRTDPV
ncbi:MAG: hypothetical protein DRH32_03690 [Deltaproteobacteria bacterium]|nr:MAG: hypothetical protein DRH32_03690 [Deltaproteobacteria bacterium]